MGGGITTELVRNVFRSRSLRASDSHEKSNMLEKRRWSTVRSYLCGEECNSVAADKDSASVRSSKGAVIDQEFTSDVAMQDSGSIWSSNSATRICEFNSDFAEEDDSASIKSSEATITQRILGETVDQDDTGNVKSKEEVRMEKPNSTLQLFQQEDAAIVIQSAFRHYLARRDRSESKLDGGNQEVEFAIPSPESIGTSVKVQTGDSTDTSSFDAERENFCQPIQKRARAQVLKLQEDWDDSTVSSTISRKRIQNRIEAATRRERALAYAFAQQLRVCSKKKRTKWNSLDSTSSLQWLERWMATRESENIFIENHRNQTLQLRSCKQETMMDAIEEKESCGSNEVSLPIDGFSLRNDNFRAPKSKDKALRSISRRKTVPSIHATKSRKKTRRTTQNQLESKKDIKFQDPLSQLLPDSAASNSTMTKICDLKRFESTFCFWYDESLLYMVFPVAPSRNLVSSLSIP